MRWTSKDALLCVDLQVDFCPGGSLGVEEGNQIIPKVNRLLQKAAKENVLIVFSRDWHPSNHSSFSPHGGPWPPHCVQNTPGAELHPDLCIPRGALIISKGTDPNREAYSAFEGTQLEILLRDHSIRRLFVCGIATDYCVRHTVLDALGKGFEIVVVQDACAGVDTKGSQRAFEEFKGKGAVLSVTDEICEFL